MTKEIEADVVIFGGGTSGIFLAWYLIEKGFKVLVIEKSASVGGALVNNLVYPTSGFHTPSFLRIGSPLVDRFINLLIHKNLSKGHLRDPLNFSSTVTPINPIAYKLLISTLLKRENFYFFPSSIVKDIHYLNNVIKFVKIVNSYGEYRISGKFFVDATGFLITSFFIPLEYYQTDIQAMTLIFRISNVDFGSIIRDIKTNPKDFYEKIDPDLMEKQSFLSVSGYFSLAKEFFKNEQLSFFRDRLLFFGQDGEVFVNTTRLFLEDIKKMCRNNYLEFSSDLEIIDKIGYNMLLDQVFYVFNIVKNNIDGFRKSYISEIANYVGVRQFRNVKGMYTLKLNDVINGDYFDDSISIGTWPIDIHIRGTILEKRINENGYGVPFRSCISSYKNLAFIGKNLSADEYAFSSVRIQATMMVLGENMGRIIEYCLQNKRYLTDLDYSSIKKIVNLQIFNN